MSPPPAVYWSGGGAKAESLKNNLPSPFPVREVATSAPTGLPTGKGSATLPGLHPSEETQLDPAGRALKPTGPTTPLYRRGTRDEECTQTGSGHWVLSTVAVVTKPGLELSFYRPRPERAALADLAADSGLGDAAPKSKLPAENKVEQYPPRLYGGFFEEK